MSLNSKSNPHLASAQRGLLMRPMFGKILTIHLKNQDKATHSALVSAVQALDRHITAECGDDCGFVAGFAPDLWTHWTGGKKFCISKKHLSEGTNVSASGGEMLLYVKAPDIAAADALVQRVLPAIEAHASKIEALALGKRSDGRVFGGRYKDHITNPNDPIRLTEDILGDGFELASGATFGLTQKFEFDWGDLSAQSGHALDAVIGRRPDGTVLSQHADRAHIHRAHVLDKNHDQRKILRQSLPFITYKKKKNNNNNNNNNKSENHVHDDNVECDDEEEDVPQQQSSDAVKGKPSREKGVMFVGFCNEQQRFEDILDNMIGKNPARPIDRLMDFVQGVGGNYWYVPSAPELGITGVGGGIGVYVEPHWEVSNPRNPWLFYNSITYMQVMAEGGYVGGDPPSARVLSLMSKAFTHWRDGWTQNQVFPPLPHLRDMLELVQQPALPASVPERKGLADLATLSYLLSSRKSAVARKNGLLRINCKELIVGIVPDFTLGRGKEVVPYLDDDEALAAFLKAALHEWSAMGHIIPDLQTPVTKGLGRMIAELAASESDASGRGDAERAEFFRSAQYSLRGCQEYLRNWADLCRREHSNAYMDHDQRNMHAVADRLDRLATEAPASFHDAVQLVYSLHTCLHLVGELTSIGRLDQIVGPLLDADIARGAITLDEAQEVIDCLFIKIGENAFVNRAFIHDHMTYGTGAVSGRGGNAPRSGALNQWVQQITVGGYKATDSPVPEDGCNAVTMLCLKAARRIPVNAPSLSLRVFRGIDQKYVDEAAKSILAGGAQPTIYNDDKLCEGLFRSGESVTRAASRDYAADGCYEPLLGGASEFVFNNVDLMPALEQALNQGATMRAAGPIYLNGLKQTFRSPLAKDIRDFEHLKEIFLEHVWWLVLKCYKQMFDDYGNLAKVCPSPLLSPLLGGCTESGRDLTNGGAKFHIISQMFVGVANTISSLYAIKKLVFDPATARCTLKELVMCLLCDWGGNMCEPFQDSTLGEANAAEKAVRYQELRQEALALPKWGSGDGGDELNDLGVWLIENCVRMSVDAIRQPAPFLKEGLQRVYDAYGPGFEWMIEPGVGTFEGYVGAGEGIGASADGRRSGEPIASDCSPVQAPQDLAAAPSHRNIYDALRTYKNSAVEIGVSSAAPVDMNIPEDFPLEDLQRFVRRFAEGETGGNYVTLTCADLATYEAAVRDTEKYELVRCRLGGWSEFFCVMFPSYQKHQQRRQYFDAPKEGETGHVARAVCSH